MLHGVVCWGVAKRKGHIGKSIDFWSSSLSSSSSSSHGVGGLIFQWASAISLFVNVLRPSNMCSHIRVNTDILQCTLMVTL